MVGAVFLYAEYVDMVVMVGGVERCQVIFTLAGDNQHLVLAEELAEQLAASVIVEPQHVAVKPYLASSEGRGSLLL